MAPQIKVHKTVAATQEFDFLYGSFELSKVHIPYFATTLTLQDAASDLRLAYEILSSEDINWSLTELFQRDIDWSRVHKKIVPYLQTSDTPQFFNSITIALLPYDPKQSRVLDRFDETVPWTPPALLGEDDYTRRLDVGPIAFGFWSEWSRPGDDGFRLGRMRWNKNEVVGVAIDGQHRLAAIKEIAGSGMPSERLIRSRVPVIFLLFDEEVGYSNFKQQATVEILRELFIDLNKHAQTVKRGRQILLDDRDPHAVCTRMIIADRLSNDGAYLNDSPPRLPLSLVDWHSDQAKFDVGPYITTVLGLDNFVSRILATKPITDWMDYPGVETQIKRLASRLKIELSSAQDRLATLAKFDMGAFTYDDTDLELITGAFSYLWVTPLANLLTQLSPYAELVAMRDHDGSLSIRFQEWYRLREAKSKEGQFEGNASAAYAQFIQQSVMNKDNPMAESDFVSMLTNIENAKGKNFAYKVVFQRALVEGFIDYCETSADDIDELSWDARDEDIDFADIALGDGSAEPEDLESSADEGDAIGNDSEPERDGAESDEAAYDGATLRLASLFRDQYEDRSREYVDALNAVIELTHFLSVDFAIESDEPVLSDKFWEGSLRKPEGDIDFTLGASTRAKDLFMVIGIMMLYCDTVNVAEQVTFDEFWSDCSNIEAGKLCKKAGRAIDRLAGETGVGGRILRAKDRDFDREAARHEIFCRLRYIWQAAGTR